MNKSTASTFLTCLGVIGVVVTAVLSAKSAQKVYYELDNAADKKYESEGSFKLTKFETVKTVAAVYAPAIVTGAATIACICGANILNKQSQASLASAYALLDASYREYSNKVKEIYGEEADVQIREEVAKNGHDIPEGEQLFYDLNSMQYFVASFDDVVQKTVTDDGLECYIISTPFDVMPRF